MSSRTAAPSIFTARRIASAVALPGVFAGMLVFASPATAATSSAPAGTTGICNGVVNQLSHRGMVQENLLKAAAKKNADIIAKLTVDRAALQTTADSLQLDITTATQMIASLEVQSVQLDKDIVAATAEVTRLTAAQTTTMTAIADAEKALAEFRTQEAAFTAELTPLQADLKAAQEAKAVLVEQAKAFDAQIVAKQAVIDAAKTVLTGLQAEARTAADAVAAKNTRSRSPRPSS
jgi:chromosome segregation ATPase